MMMECLWHVPSLRQVSHHASGVIAQFQYGLTNGFLLQSRIVDTGRAGVTCGAGRDVVHPQRRVLMQIVDPAAVQCLPSIVRQEPIGVMATPSFRFSCIE